MKDTESSGSRGYRSWSYSGRKIYDPMKDIVGKTVVAMRSVEDNKNHLVVKLEAEDGGCLRPRQT